MPEMNGVDVLKAVKKCSPSTIRGILSGFTDNKTIVRTLMGNLSHFYLNKPWNNRELQHFIARIISLKETLSSPQSPEPDERTGTPSLTTGTVQDNNKGNTGRITL